MPEIYLTDPEGYSIYNSVWSKLFAASLVKDMRFFKGRNSEDIPYTTEAFCRMERAAYLDAPFYHYVVGRSGSIMDKDRERMFRDEIPHWRWHVDCIRRYGMETLARLAEYQYYKRLLLYFFRAEGETAERLKEIILEDKPRIQRIYQESFVKKSDRTRMSLFLKSPSLYKSFEKAYRFARRL